MLRFHKRIALAILLALSSTISFSANGYTSSKLHDLAHELNGIPFEQLGEGSFNNFSHDGCSLNIRVNRWDEVEHIGFCVFDRNTLQEDQGLVADFVERYLLELDLVSPADRIHRMNVDKVSLEEGSLDNIPRLNDCSRCDIMKIPMIKYQVAWYDGDQCLFRLSFAMDYQLLSGCNSIELENNYLRDVNKNYQLTDYVAELPSDNTDEDFAIVNGGTYFNHSIRADRYYIHGDAGWDLVCSDEKPYWSAANVMLSPEKLGDFQLKCTLDMYGYKEESFRIAIEQWVSKTLSEGCKLFLGVKSKTQKSIHATLFCPNFNGGYCHLMTLEIPIDMFDKNEGVVIGRLYTYVPLHNIEKDYFDAEFINVSGF